MYKYKNVNYTKRDLIWVYQTVHNSRRKGSLRGVLVVIHFWCRIKLFFADWKKYVHFVFLTEKDPPFSPFSGTLLPFFPLLYWLSERYYRHRKYCHSFFMSQDPKLCPEFWRRMYWRRGGSNLNVNEHIWAYFVVKKNRWRKIPTAIIYLYFNTNNISMHRQYLRRQTSWQSLNSALSLWFW